MKVLSAAACCFLLVGTLFGLVHADARVPSDMNNMRTLLDDEVEEEECPLVASCCEEDCCGKGTSWDLAVRHCVLDAESDGFDGTHSNVWIPGCVERACCNQDCCSTFTDYNQEIASCVPTNTTTTSCVPTTGPCVATFSQFQQVASQAMNNDVIALCGGKEIVTQTAVVLNKPNMTLCCAATDCIVKSAGTDRNLAVTGGDFTVQDVFFYNGNFDGDNGGNVDISAPGNHVIESCEFHNGRAIRYGGNLNVQDADSVAIRKSMLLNGNSPDGGGGLAVWNTSEWSLDDCVLEGNKGFNGGGAFSSQLYPEVSSQSISMTRTRFHNNSASWGGGYLATTIGTLPSLSIRDCVFDDNVAVNGNGGAAMVIQYADLSTLDLSFSGNTGSGNAALSENYDCDDFSVYVDTPGPLCIGVSEDFQA